jgi:UDP-N-acetylglucosamine 2-epimerase (non-hydrolysing)
VRVLSVVGARPNFMKLAPLARALAARPGVEHVVVHTGQHYDRNMSDTFFEDLGAPEPHHNLEVGSGSHAAQTAAIMQRFEPVLLAERPDVVLVYGDVNSTVAAALVAAKLGVRVGHVEAGLRSRDWSMPEEINRVLTDRLANLLFTPSRDADENLVAEGVAPERIHFVGNIMIDSLVALLPRARSADTLARFGLTPGEFVVVTLHRPSNVDDGPTLTSVMRALARIAERHPVLFPVHPRTRNRLEQLGEDRSAGSEGKGPGKLPLTGADSRLRLIEPLGYVDMLCLVQAAGLVITDSGGLQEETSFLGVPCLTVRPNTERPITITHGTNRLVASEEQAIVAAATRAWGTRGARPIERWDGRTAERIVEILLR